MKSIYERFVRRALLFMLTIQLSMLGFGATYYVSNTGNDANSGLTIAQPWKTLAKVNASKFVAGDLILFKSGDVWEELLYIPSSGTVGNNIILSSYGVGIKPEIRAYGELTGWNIVSNWTLHATGIYKIALTTQNYRLWLNDVEKKECQTLNLTNESPWKWTGGYLYVKSDIIPTDEYNSIIISRKRDYACIVDLKRHITLKNLKFTGGNYTISFYGSSDCIIEDCEIGYRTSGSGIVVGGSPSVYANNNIIRNNVLETGDAFYYEFYKGYQPTRDGVALVNGTTNTKVYNNYFNSWSHTGIAFVGLNAARPFNNNEAYNNYITAPLLDYARGLEADFHSEGYNNSMHHNTVVNTTVRSQFNGNGLKVYENIIDNVMACPYPLSKMNVGNGFSIEGYAVPAINMEIYNNTILNCADAGIHITSNNPGLQLSNNNIHDNNVFNNGINSYNGNQTNLQLYCTLNAPVINNNTYSKNHFYSSNSINTIKYGKTFYTAITFNSLISTNSDVFYENDNVLKFGDFITNANDVKIEHNGTKFTKTILIDRPMVDSKGNKYLNSVTIQPYSSVILMKDLTAAVVPGAPTSVVATAGNATASVSFVAPANNGGSAITGYTVTSIPAGGTDTNAGSTSLTHTITGLTNGTTYTFTVKATNSVGSSVASVASNSVIPKAPVAGTFTFTGPSSGNVNTASTSYTVTPNALYTGTITLTPTGTASTGLAAKVLTFSNSSAAQTFTITPTVAGSITLIPTNSGTLTNPSNLIYTANAVAPSVPTSVVAAAGNASASVSFAAPANIGGSAITGYTVTSIPAGGVDTNAGSTSLTHTITGLINGTTYTFTVKATNSVGTSEASVTSNLVIPLAPSDNTPPVISSFLMPTSATSLTVPITALSASDNIGVTGYLLTETPLTPSSGATGWTITTPLNYTFSSAGLNAVYAWVKDAAGNVSASVMQEVTVTLETKQGSIPPTHFIPVWNGENGLNHMNIMVVSADLEDLPLSPEDEIAVFSGSKCVGSMRLSKTISPDDNSSFLTIPASQDDGSGNGFTINDTIVFKIWDNKNQQEMIAKAVVYKNNVSSWLTGGKYVAGATSVVEIVSYTEYSQTIQLKKGYNMISTFVSAQNPMACHVTQSLADDGYLTKLQDEAGNSLENWGSFGGWVNNIGTLEKTEGYKIKVTDNCLLLVTGRPIALPLNIPLKTGWNIISFPRTDLVNAMNIIQPLIDQNKLLKVQDEAGNSIENWGIFGGWKNGIGYFTPGKAYKVKMNTDAVLAIQENYLKSAVMLASKEQTEYFSTEVEGNGSEHVNINIVGIGKAGIVAGDEFAAFDGDICVGVLKVTENHIIDGSASLVASISSDTNTNDGFTEGHDIKIIVWNKLTGNESEVQADVINGQLKYAKNSSVLLNIKSLTTDVRSFQDMVTIDVFPNPSQGMVTVRFSNFPDAGSSIEILDISGRKVASRVVTGMSEVFNLDQQPAGVYLVKSKLGSKETIQKLVIN